MISDPAALNKKCKIPVFELPIRKYSPYQYVYAPATELNCNYACAMNPKCVGVTGVIGEMRKDPNQPSNKDWCIGCSAPMDQLYPPNSWEANSNPTGHSIAFKKTNMP